MSTIATRALKAQAAPESAQETIEALKAQMAALQAKLAGARQEAAGYTVTAGKGEWVIRIPFASAQGEGKVSSTGKSMLYVSGAGKLPESEGMRFQLNVYRKV